MDWNTPLGILRRGMSLERDGYRFYTLAAERASDERGSRMFRDLARQEEDHLRLLLAEYRSLEAGQGWLPYEVAIKAEFPLDPANPDLPGEEPPDPLPVFTPDRPISLEGDIAALEFGLETERLSGNCMPGRRKRPITLGPPRPTASSPVRKRPTTGFCRTPTNISAGARPGGTPFQKPFFTG